MSLMFCTFVSPSLLISHIRCLLNGSVLAWSLLNLEEADWLGCRNISCFLTLWYIFSAWILILALAKPKSGRKKQTKLYETIFNVNVSLSIYYCFPILPSLLRKTNFPWPSPLVLGFSDNMWCTACPGSRNFGNVNNI